MRLYAEALPSVSELLTAPITFAASAWGDWSPLVAGIFIGIVLGFAAHCGRFCTLGAFERYWYANEAHGLRDWALAGVTAILTTHLAMSFGWIATDNIAYLTNAPNLILVATGGVMFGLGMSLVGTCTFGALLRAGGGSLAAMVVTLVVGIFALITLRGVLRPLRETLHSQTQIDLGPSTSQSIGSVVQSLTGLPLTTLVTVFIAIFILYLVWVEPSYRSRHKEQACAVTVGLCITAGWLATSGISEQLFSLVQIESASFVLPPGEILLAGISPTPRIPDYGIGLVLGVLSGAFISAAALRQIRWEACDSARELGRHVIGAILMGVGGILAGGCTIGQGLSALSVLAVSAPIALLGIMLGARIGLIWLIEGRLPLLKGN